MFTVVLIIAILETIALVMHAVKSRRYDGSVVVTDTETKKTYSLEIDSDPETLDQKKQIVLKIRQNSDE